MGKRYYHILAIALGMVLLVALQPGLIAHAEFGTNWTGIFYNTTDLTGALVDTGTYPNGLNENWGTGSPVDALRRMVPPLAAWIERGKGWN